MPALLFLIWALTSTLMAHLVHLGITTAVTTLHLPDHTVVSNTIIEIIGDDPRRDLVEVQGNLSLRFDQYPLKIMMAQQTPEPITDL